MVSSVVLLMALLALGWLTTVWVMRRLRRPIVLVKGHWVPLRWRWSWSGEALLHRRLVLALGRMRLAVPSRRGAEGPWSELALEVEALALDIDRSLLSQDGQPHALRRQARSSLRSRVAEVEVAAARVAAGATSGVDAGGQGRSMEETMERLGAVEAAMDELRGAETGRSALSAPLRPRT